MGHTYVNIGSNTLRLKDSTFWGLRHFILLNLNDIQDSSYKKDIIVFVKSWEWHGPGIITGLDFNNDVFTTQHYKVFLQVLDLVQSTLENFEGSIPIEYAQKNLSVSGLTEYYGAPSTDLFIDYIDQIRSIIELNYPKAQQLPSR